MLTKKQVFALSKWGLLAIVLWLGLVSAEIIQFAGINSSQSADTAIALGAAIQNDRPSPVFQARIDHAIALFQRRQVQSIIFTGGQGEGDRLSESQAAKNYAIDQGIPPDRIFTESISRTTRQNLLEAQKIIQAQNFSNCLLVSDPLHMKRADWMMRDLGISGRPSPTPSTRYQSWQSQVPFLLREIYFYHHYWLFKQ